MTNNTPEVTAADRELLDAIREIISHEEKAVWEGAFEYAIARHRHTSTTALEAENLRLREGMRLATRALHNYADACGYTDNNGEPYTANDQHHPGRLAEATLDQIAALSTPSEVSEPVADNAKDWEITPVPESAAQAAEEAALGNWPKSEDRVLNNMHRSRRCAFMEGFYFAHQSDASIQAIREENQKLREAVTTIIGRCEALEYEASDRLAAEDYGDIERGYFNGQKATAKSLRRHLHDMTRATRSTPSRVSSPVDDEIGGEKTVGEEIAASAHRSDVFQKLSFAAVTVQGHFPAAAQMIRDATDKLPDAETLYRFEQSGTLPSTGDAVREALRKTLYEGLCWFGTLPEPEGDVPERYHRWDDLCELADRLLAALNPTQTEGEGR